MVDPKLIAHAMKLQKAAETMTTDRARFNLTALDMLDYLGKKIDEDKAREAEATRP